MWTMTLEHITRFYHLEIQLLRPARLLLRLPTEILSSGQSKKFFSTYFFLLSPFSPFSELLSFLDLWGKHFQTAWLANPKFGRSKFPWDFNLKMIQFWCSHLEDPLKEPHVEGEREEQDQYYYEQDEDVVPILEVLAVVILWSVHSPVIDGSHLSHRAILASSWPLSPRL